MPAKAKFIEIPKKCDRCKTGFQFKYTTTGYKSNLCRDCKKLQSAVANVRSMLKDTDQLLPPTFSEFDAVYTELGRPLPMRVDEYDFTMVSENQDKTRHKRGIKKTALAELEPLPMKRETPEKRVVTGNCAFCGSKPRTLSFGSNGVQFTNGTMTFKGEEIAVCERCETVLGVMSPHDFVDLCLEVAGHMLKD